MFSCLFIQHSSRNMETFSLYNSVRPHETTSKESERCIWALLHGAIIQNARAKSTWQSEGTTIIHLQCNHGCITISNEIIIVKKKTLILNPKRFSVKKYSESILHLTSSFYQYIQKVILDHRKISSLNNIPHSIKILCTNYHKPKTSIMGLWYLW